MEYIAAVPDMAEAIHNVLHTTIGGQGCDCRNRLF